MKKYFIYKWTSKSTGMMYIGSHCGTEDDGYVSSSNYFNTIYNEHPEDFDREIIYYGESRMDILTKEQNMLCSVDASNSIMYYNLHNFSGKGWSHHDNPDLAKIYYTRISESRKGKPSPHKGKRLWGEHNRHKLCIDTWLVRDPNENEFEVLNMLDFCKQNNLNPSAMSAVARGKRRMHKGYWCKKLTNKRNVEYKYKEWQSKGNSSKALYGSKNGFSKSIVVEGVEYGSMREAVDATGLSMYKLRKLRNKNEQ